MMYVVIDKCGVFVGYPSEDLNVARALALRKPGRRVYILAEDKNTKDINSVCDFHEQENAPKNPVNCYCDGEGRILQKCPVYDYECYYCDEYGYCELENPETECDDFIENILYEDV